MNNNSIFERHPDDKVVSGNYAGTIRYEFLLLPILKILHTQKDGVFLSKAAIYENLTKNISFNDKEKQNRIQSVRDKKTGLINERDYKNPEYVYKGNWAICYLNRGGYIEKSSDKEFRITSKGRSKIQEWGLDISDNLDDDSYRKYRREIVTEVNKISKELASDNEEESKPEVSSDGNYDEKYNYYSKIGQIVFITFHPSYSYEDFIEGIRPDTANTELKFRLTDGSFKNICGRALHAAITGEVKENVTWSAAYSLYREMKKDEIDFESAPKFVLIIDEINRGDISKIFGELITLIEKDKRLGEDNEIVVTLPYSKEQFSIPSNLYIIGTMNTADRSLALIDVALRRRFDFEEMKPEIEELRKNPQSYRVSESLIGTDAFKQSLSAVENLNKELGKNEDIGKDKRIGHAFFCNLKEENEVGLVWINKIWPLLEEYYFFDRTELANLSNGAYSYSDGWNKDKLEAFLDTWSSKPRSE